MATPAIGREARVHIGTRRRRERLGRSLAVHPNELSPSSLDASGDIDQRSAFREAELRGAGIGLNHTLYQGDGGASHFEPLEIKRYRQESSGQRVDEMPGGG